VDNRNSRLAGLGTLTLLVAAWLAGCGSHSIQPGVARPGLVARANVTSPPPGILADTWSGIHAFQVFDAHIPPLRATAHAYRYELVWGTRDPQAWLAGNPAIIATYYAPFDSDFTKVHGLKWWLGHHHDWILYKCDQKTPAWPSGLKYVPLDISNPAVAQWQMATYAPVMENGGYSGFGADLVSLDNASLGCGVFIHGVWTQKFSGQQVDEAWAQAVLAWTQAVVTALHSQPRPLVFGANHVPESRPFGDADEEAFLNLIDFDDDESSFTNYGQQPVTTARLTLIVQWMQYIQGLGKAFIVDDKWNTPTTTQQELGWSIGTYLLGTYHQSALFTDHLPGYGYEYSFPQYNAAVSKPCADMIADPNDKGIFTRKYQGAYVVVNASLSQRFSVTLPKPSYKSIFGGTVTSPVSVPPDTGDILLTSHGCQ